MNILITGSGGFIGKSLANSLSKSHEVIGLTSVAGKLNAPIKEFYLDLSNHNSVAAFIKQLKASKKQPFIDLVVHTAGKLAHKDPMENIEVLETNNRITFNLMEIIKGFNVNTLINLSSMSVYPYEDGTFSETSLCEPEKNEDFLYGLSKLNSEKILSAFLKDFNFRFVNLRLAQVYGQDMRQDRIMPVFLQELKENNTITVLGMGKRRLNFIHIERLIFILNFFISSRASGTFNTGNENLSLLEIAKNLVNKEGNKASRIIKVPEGRRENFILDTSKLENLLENEQK